MLRTHTITVGLAVALLGLASTVAFAQEDSPYTRGVIATITTFDAQTGMATLRTEEGEVFELPKASDWHRGHKVLCDRLAYGLHARLQRCQLWESAHEAGAAAAGSTAPRRGQHDPTELPRPTARPEVPDTPSVRDTTVQPALQDAPAFRREVRPNDDAAQ